MGRRRSQFSVDDSYLLTDSKLEGQITDSKLEGQKNVNATVGLLCKLDFVIHSVRSILKPTQKYNLLLLSYIR